VEAPEGEQAAQGTVLEGKARDLGWAVEVWVEAAPEEGRVRADLAGVALARAVDSGSPAECPAAVAAGLDLEAPAEDQGVEVDREVAWAVGLGLEARVRDQVAVVDQVEEALD
jgi:hypothetical protein